MRERIQREMGNSKQYMGVDNPSVEWEDSNRQLAEHLNIALVQIAQVLPVRYFLVRCE